MGGRIELHTADLRELPFDDDKFDVVVSSIAVHNLRDAADRRIAITEAARVLRRGGRLVIADIRATDEYAAVLGDLGFDAIEVRSAGPNFWFSGPWQGVKVVTASKSPTSKGP